MDGTENSDFLGFQGDMQQLTITLINPYSGELLQIDDEFLVNSQNYDGKGGFDYLLMSNTGDALFLDKTSFYSTPNVQAGAVTIQNVEYIIAGEGGDIINLSSYTNTLDAIRIDGGAGDDILWTNDGDDIVSGLDGNDHIVTGAGNDHLKGQDDDDYLNGGTGADFLEGGNGDDILTYSVDAQWASAAGDNALYDITGTNHSYDTFKGDTGYDVLNLTDGADTLLITDNASPRHNSSGGDRVNGIENINAGAGDDIIDLANSSIYGEDIEINGGEGDDFIRAGSGDDVLYGGAGNDALYGGAGDDILYGGNNSGAIETNAHLFANDHLFPSLQERKHIKKVLGEDSTPIGISDGDLSVEYSTTATFTFHESGAGYRNTLGFYRINHEDGTIEGIEIGFTNVKDYDPGTAYSVTLPGAPDSDFGFFIIANGYTHNKSYRDIDMNGENLRFIYDLGGENERAATIFDDGDDVSLIYDDGSVIKPLKGEVYHTTERGGDTSINADEKDHVVSGLIDENDQSVLRIGFEDLKNLGDADYNDVVFDLKIAGQTVDTSEQGNDVLVGGGGNDQLYGEGGHDLLVMGEGADIAYGGSGHDIFNFNVLDSQTDIIADYNIMGDQDILDIANILDGYDPLSDAISDFVQLSATESGDTIIQVNDGAAFVDAVQIIGGLGDNTLQELIDNGSLVVEHSAL
jgi:Ca2+-binding RTX toxin-like protein